MLTWNSVGFGVSYFVAKRQIGNLNFDPGWITTDTSWQFVNMTPGTNYVWHVRTVCSPGNHSSWSPLVPFTTTSNICTNTPTGLTTGNKTTSSIKLRWDTLSPQPDKYQIRYRIKGDLTWTYLTCAGNLTSRLVSGLTAGAKYEWQIRGRCGISAPYDYSAWSIVATFKLPLVRLADDADELSFNVFPNPTTGIVTLTVSDCENCRYNLMLHDAIGRTVFTEDVTFSLKAIQFNLISAVWEKGIYALTVNSDITKQVLKLLIQ